MLAPLRLDLGAGKPPKEGYASVDVLAGSDYEVDLCDGRPWPFETESIEALYSSHFIEHIPTETLPGGRDRFFWFFDEAYRIARPGAEFELRWPVWNSVWAYQDPTHRRFIPPQTLGYLSARGRDILRVSSYNVRCNWEIVGNVLLLGQGDPPEHLETAAKLVRA
jgi:hypothetical protein